MSKTRKRQMIEALEEKIEMLEELLVDTPPDMTEYKYRKLIKDIKEAR